MNRIVIALAGAGVLVVVSACAGSSGSPPSTISSDSGITVQALEGIRWDSSSYRAAPGTVRIVLENESSLPHNLVVVDADQTQLPTVLDVPARNDTAAGTFALEVGTYTLLCRIPGHGNMNARLDIG